MLLPTPRHKTKKKRNKSRWDWRARTYWAIVTIASIFSVPEKSLITRVKSHCLPLSHINDDVYVVSHLCLES